MAAKKIKLGIAGIGRAGWGMHSPEVEKYKDLFEVTAACDIEADRLDLMEKRFPGCKKYLKFSDMLKDKNVEMVSVAVRSPEHTQFALDALKAGKYVFIEKPIALTYADAQRLVAASKKYPGKLFCRHNRRFEQQFNHIREIIASGILGDVYEIQHNVHSYQRRDDWQAIIECGGGQLNNWGPHLIDHALQLLESPVKDVWSDLKKVTAVGDAEDHVKIILRGENKRIVEIEISGGVAIPSPSYLVYGTRGTLVCIQQDIQLKYLDPKQKLEPITAKKESPSITGSFGRQDKFRWIRKTIMIEAKNPDTEFDIYKYVYNAIRKGAKFPITIEEAAEVVRITEIVKNNSEFKMPSAEPSVKAEKKAAPKKAKTGKGTRRK